MSIAAGLKTYDYFTGPMITFETDEGDLVVTEDEMIAHRGDEHWVGTFESPIKTGNCVKIKANWRIELCAKGDQEVLGFAAKNAQPQKGKKIIYEEAGTYLLVYREVTVEVFGVFTRTVTMGTGVAVLGDSIKHDTAGAVPANATLHTWEASGSLAGPVYVLRVATEDSVDVATALYGYWGPFA